MLNKNTNPDSVRARDALDHFYRVYLPEHPTAPESNLSEEARSFYAIEDGWLGIGLKGTTLVFAFECPDQETARTVVEEIQ